MRESKYFVDGHHVFSPSGSKLRCTCPGSAALSIGIQRKQDKKYTEEGHIAHALAEKCLNEGVKASTIKEVETSDGIKKVPRGMASNVQKYVDAIKNREDEVYGVEITTDLEDVLKIPEDMGTADYVGYCAETKTAYVDDLKYGKWAEVKAKNNTQMVEYFAGLIDEIEMICGPIENVVLSIHQVRKKAVESWKLTRAEFEEYLGYVKKKEAEAWDLYQKRLKNSMCPIPTNPELEACKFCPAKIVCMGFANIIPQWLKSATDIRFKAADLMRRYAEEMMYNLYVRMTGGEKIKELKLVEGRAGNRSWIGTDKEVAEQLKSLGIKVKDMYEKKLISPATAEKLLDKEAAEEINPMCSRTESGLSVVLQSDPRPEYVEVSDDDLGDFE